MPFLCPRCQRTSHHPMDALERYCGFCRDWTGRGIEQLSSFYVLNESNEPVRARMEEWGAMMEDVTGRTVDLTTFYTPMGEARVSTVFLGLDHNFFGTGPPILFETMIFGGIEDDYQHRYCTWSEAEAGHKATVARLMARYVVSEVEGQE